MGARRQRVTVTRCRGEYAEARILLVGAAEIWMCERSSCLIARISKRSHSYLLPPAESKMIWPPSVMNSRTLHDPVFNAVGDADRGARFLDRASNVFRKLDRPIVNPPDRPSGPGATLFPSC